VEGDGTRPLLLIVFDYLRYAVSGWPHSSASTPACVVRRIISEQTGTPALGLSGLTEPWVHAHVGWTRPSHIWVMLFSTGTVVGVAIGQLPFLAGARQRYWRCSPPSSPHLGHGHTHQGSLDHVGGEAEEEAEEDAPGSEFFVCELVADAEQFDDDVEDGSGEKLGYRRVRCRRSRGSLPARHPGAGWMGTAVWMRRPRRRRARAACHRFRSPCRTRRRSLSAGG
jgi:hypothetical protein